MDLRENHCLFIKMFAIVYLGRCKLELLKITHHSFFLGLSFLLVISLLLYLIPNKINFL